VRYLARLGCRIRVTDRKSSAALAPSLRALSHVSFERRLGGHRVSDVRWADVVVQNPAVPRDAPLVRAARRLGKPVVNDAVLFLAAAPGPVIAVTGTRGKSTTVALTAAMLGCPRAGLPGEPLLDALAALAPGQPVVAEFSSWQCELLPENRSAPDVAVLTNLSSDHLNRYASYAAYARAKAGLLLRQVPFASAAVVNRDVPVFRPFGRLVAGHRFWFSRKPFAEVNGAYLERGWFTQRYGGRTFRVAPRRTLRVPGDHLTENALAAIAAAWSVAPDPLRIRRALETFRGLPGRQELVAVRRGVRYVNDTTATSPAGVLAALRTFTPGRTVLITGGEDKALDFHAMARAVRRVRVLVLLPGTATDRLARLLPPHLPTHVASMAEAVRTAAGAARPGDTVLLSPGAASFNLFRHEYDRGEKFVAAVERLP
jgi:UDP-N-acetylmuramoylalanine--D-glutamate ligase